MGDGEYLSGVVPLTEVGLRAFLRNKGAEVWYIDERSLGRALDWMDHYSDHPMDFADASVVAAAEALRITTVFALDRGDFSAYRVRIGSLSAGFG